MGEAVVSWRVQVCHLRRMRQTPCFCRHHHCGLLQSPTQEQAKGFAQPWSPRHAGNANYVRALLCELASLGTHAGDKRVTVTSLAGRGTSYGWLAVPYMHTLNTKTYCWCRHSPHQSSFYTCITVHTQRIGCCMLMLSTLSTCHRCTQ